MTADEKLTLLTQLMNESLEMCGLPELSRRKTRAFVQTNALLKMFTPQQIAKLTDDYGLLLPALILSDINADYATILQARTSIDIGGFVLYLDTWFIRSTNNDKAIMSHLSGITNVAPKEIRRLYIQQLLEEMVNTHGVPATEIIEQFIHKAQTINALQKG